MNINRHNYEEYFILYADNELSPAERRMVENFVALHPDLQEELDLVLQTKLIPDDHVVYENKDELLKVSGGGDINLVNYQEWLLLYIDDELTPGQKKDVEKFAAANEMVQQELAVLQKTKLRPETIVFPFKTSLYRQPGKGIVWQPAFWRKSVYRMTAAAVLLLAIGLSVFLFLKNRKHVAGEVVSVSDAKQQTVNAEKTQTGKTASGTMMAGLPADNPNEVEPADVKNPVSKNNHSRSAIAHSRLPGRNKAVNDQKTNNQKYREPLALSDISEQPANNLPQPVESPDVKNNHVSIANSNTKPPASINDDVVTNETPKPYLTNDGTTVNNAGKPDVVFTSFDEESNNNNRSRGFFRKAVRFFEKTTKINPANDDDRVLIGGLAVKLK